MQKQEIFRAVLDYLSRKWPDGESVTACGWQQLGSGWECDIFAFDVLADADLRQRHPLALRLYPSPSADSLRGEVHHREYRIMQHLHSQGYPVPRAYFAGKLPAPDCRSFVIMRRIDDAQPVSSALARADSQRSEQIFEDFCRLQVQLHQLDIPAFLAEPRGEDKAIPSLMQQLEQFMKAADLHQLQPAMKWLECRSRGITPGSRAVVHWDYHPENVLLTADDCRYVLDWSSAEVRDRRFDVGSTWMFLPRELSEKYLLTYQRIAEASVSSVEFFLAAACLRRLVVIGTVMQCGPQKLGLRPEVEQLVPDAVRSHLDDVCRRFEQLTGVAAVIDG